jgi:hypothetical protein
MSLAGYAALADAFGLKAPLPEQFSKRASEKEFKKLTIAERRELELLYSETFGDARSGDGAATDGDRSITE